MSFATLPPALFLGPCTHDNDDSDDSITNDLLDEIWASSDGEAQPPEIPILIF
jgi:hypothetical protein